MRGGFDTVVRRLLSMRGLLLAFSAATLLLAVVWSGVRYQQRMQDAVSQQMHGAEQHAHELQLLAANSRDPDSQAGGHLLPSLVRAWAPQDGRSWVLQHDALVLADSGLDMPRHDARGERWSLHAPAGIGEGPVLDAQEAGGSHAQKIGHWLLVLVRPAGSPWTYVNVIPWADLRAQVLPTLVPNAVFLAVLLLTLAAAQWFIWRYFVRPSDALFSYLRALSINHRAPAPELPARWKFWADALADTFARQHELQADEREAREEIERQRESLRQSEKLSAMGSLLAGVAHELNNPLAIVMGRAALLEDKLRDGPLLADARRIREASERCGRLVHSFLNMARSKPAQHRPVLLNDVVRNAADLLSYGLRSHGISLELKLDPQLQPLLGDVDQLGQVMLNLLVNAQQALAEQPGPRQIAVTSGLVSQTSQGPCQWVRVKDNGPGVDPAVRERLFEPFFTTKAEGLGTGLGLSVSRDLLREHGGELILEETAPGDGTCFLLTLPCGGLGRLAPASLPSRLPEIAEHPSARLLVVDDEPMMTATMRDTLEAEGYEVATAESGAIAMALLAEARFDAVISDLRMPDQNGADLWRELRSQHPALVHRLMFITGDILSPSTTAFVQGTGCPVLEKPFSPQELLANVRRLVVVAPD